MRENNGLLPFCSSLSSVECLQELPRLSFSFAGAAPLGSSSSFTESMNRGGNVESRTSGLKIEKFYWNQQDSSFLICVSMFLHCSLCIADNYINIYECIHSCIKINVQCWGITELSRALFPLSTSIMIQGWKQKPLGLGGPSRR